MKNKYYPYSSAIYEINNRRKQIREDIIEIILINIPDDISHLTEEIIKKCFTSCYSKMSEYNSLLITEKFLIDKQNDSAN